MLPVVLRTPRLVLDVPTLDDRERVAQYCADPVFERFMTLPWPYTLEDAESFLATVVPTGWASENEFTWAIRTSVGGPLLGMIGHRAALGDIGFWLGAPHRGHGYMTETVGVLADWLFDRGLDTLRWECLVGNSASARVARTAGFTFTGVAPARVTARDGGHPESWHGLLNATDSRAEKDGWPG